MCTFHIWQYHKQNYNTLFSCFQEKRHSITALNVIKAVILVQIKVKGHLQLLTAHHLTATVHHLPYGITVLPATWHKQMHPALTPPMQAGTRFIYPEDGRLSWPSWLDSAPARNWTSNLSITSPMPNHCTTKTISSALSPTVWRKPSLHHTAIDWQSNSKIYSELYWKISRFPQVSSAEWSSIGDDWWGYFAAQVYGAALAALPHNKLDRIPSTVLDKLIIYPFFANIF